MRLFMVGLVATFSLVHLAAAAQENGGREPKQAVAMRVNQNAIDVDGRLDEPAWAAASPMTDFVQKEPTEGAMPAEKTEIRFVYDDTGLYIGARMHKLPGSALQAPIGRRDRGEQAEHVLVALDTFHDRQTAYVFGVTASGVRIDRFHPQDNETVFEESYDPVWAARTATDADGWTAELWIPFSQLRFNAATEHTWGLNVRRFTPTLNEDDYWVPVPRTVTAWSSRFGSLSGIRGLKSTRRIEVLPYVAGASAVLGNADPANPFRHDGRLEGRGGADLKIGIGPNLTLDATVNPDFGQVEADPAEVNLSAFETVFTEKRQFFIEGANLMNLRNSVFFYSRRIGAPPSVAVTGDFVRRPQTNTILGAAKLTGRLPSGTSLGLLGALTDQETARIANRASPGVVTSARVAARTGYFVGRVQQEFGPSQSTTSAMVTAMHRGMSDMDPLAALLVRNAIALGGDLRLRLKGGEYELLAIGGGTYIDGEPAAIARMQRSSAHYFQRPDKDYAPYDPTRSSLSGYRMGATVQRIGGRHWLWSLSNDNQSPTINLNEVGYFRSGDGRRVNADLHYRETVPGRLLRGYTIGVRNNNEFNFGGNRQTGIVQVYTRETWRNFWTTEGSFGRNLRLMDASLTRGGPLMEEPGGWTANLLLRNRPSSSTSWSGQVTLGRTDDGGRTDDVTVRLTFRPGPRWQFSIDPSFVQQVDMQQYIATLDGGRPATYNTRYVFAAIDRSTYSTQFRVTYTLKPDLTLDVYAEPFAASGRYSNHGELAAPATALRRTYGADGTTVVIQGDASRVVNDGSATFTLENRDFNVRSFRSNVVLRWEYRPGSTFYAVWQQDRLLSEPIGERIGFADPFRSLSAPGNNYFVVKTSFWLPIR